MTETQHECNRSYYTVVDGSQSNGGQTSAEFFRTTPNNPLPPRISVPCRNAGAPSTGDISGRGRSTNSFHERVKQMGPPHGPLVPGMSLPPDPSARLRDQRRGASDRLFLDPGRRNGSAGAFWIHQKSSPIARGYRPTPKPLAGIQKLPVPGLTIP